ncbi:glycosyltransferase family 4 protein [Cytophaga aurantiaca]|uniref:glycosyltransferase family 4 protein n=1 Tax=Cytophaga aurantiaca TaxID=29530 RepID=UPI000361A454|nr:glycosyltransferase family 4 protein [Cytophaga aurantiaca]
MTNINPKKIAFLITSTGWGGLEMNTLKLAKLLSEKGYSITLITQSTSSIYTQGKEIFASTILLQKKRKYFDFGAAKKISVALKTNGIDTIFVFDNKDLDVVAWTKKLFYKQLFVLYQQHMQIGINKKDFLHTFRFNAIDIWISPLEYLKKEVVHRTKFPEEKIRVVPLCLDTMQFTTKKYSKAEALSKLNFQPKAPLVGIIGRIGEKKGQLFLVEALLKLKSKGIAIELLIFGSPTVNDPECQTYYDHILETIKEHQLENSVHLIPYQKDVALFYTAVDVFALASHSETYGMVTIEAMLSGLPILATHAGGTSEILDYGKLGLLYEYENQEDFCTKLISLLNNTEEANNMGKRAFENASKKFQQEIEVNGMDAIIKNRN